MHMHTFHALSLLLSYTALAASYDSYHMRAAVSVIAHASVASSSLFRSSILLRYHAAHWHCNTSIKTWHAL